MEPAGKWELFRPVVVTSYLLAASFQFLAELFNISLLVFAETKSNFVSGVQNQSFCAGKSGPLHVIFAILQSFHTFPSFWRPSLFYSSL